MNVSLKNNDAVSGIVKLEIVKADYADQVDKSLRSPVSYTHLTLPTT